MQPGALNSNRTPVLLLGASIRALASSAARAGFAPLGADLFADQDTAEVADITQVDSYPDALEAFALQQPAMPWTYTGGLENWPAIVERMSAVHRLWGCDGPSLRLVRCQSNLAQWAQAARLQASSDRTDGAGTPTTNVPFGSRAAVERWLAKSSDSAGGLGVRVIEDPLALQIGERSEPWIAGPVGSASYVSWNNRSVLLGMTWQICGNDASPFVYAGSWGPAQLSPRLTQRLEQLGQIVAAAADVRGLWGVDWVLDSTEQLNLLEINPRWTASMEVLEAAAAATDAGLPSLFALHAAAATMDGEKCQSLASRYKRAIASPQQLCGKRIVYAQRDGLAANAWDWRSAHVLAPSNPSTTWRFADVPSPRAHTTRGEPLCTILASGPNQTALLEALAAGTVEARLHVTGPTETLR